MIEGVMRHGTEMTVGANYVDTHGRSEIGFGITRLLNVELLPHIKRINRARLYRPTSGEPDAYPQLGSALTRPVRWNIIAEQYDQMIRYATAIRNGSASTETILRRFLKANATHPPTRPSSKSDGPRRPRSSPATCVTAPCNARSAKASTSPNRGTAPATSSAMAAEASSPAMTVTNKNSPCCACASSKPALVYINTLMIQDVLADWAGVLTPEDHRGLTPLFWTHVSPTVKSTSAWPTA